MRLARFLAHSGKQHFGIIEADNVIDFGPDESGDQLIAALQERPSEAGRPRRALTEVRLLAPLLNPQKVICIGLNYEDHRLEIGAERPEEPLIFSKFASSIIGPNDAIQIPKAAPNRVDYEAELAVVIGRPGHDIAIEDAMCYVAGYTVANDVTARDWQVRKPGGQWLLGKTFDTFLPLGPVIVTTDEVADPNNLPIRCIVSGDLLQDSKTSELIFNIPTLIAYMSQVFSLQPGDVILTGTPGGVGMSCDPRRFLVDGDLVETEIDGIGRMVNPVRGPSVG